MRVGLRYRWVPGIATVRPARRDDGRAAGNACPGVRLELAGQPPAAAARRFLSPAPAVCIVEGLADLTVLRGATSRKENHDAE